MTILFTTVGFLLLVALFDVLQRENAIRRNFPIIGHFRGWLSALGPELRQYIVADNDEERPFCRDERQWVEQSSKLENNYFGFGTDNEIEIRPNYLIIKHTAFPLLAKRKGDPGFDPQYPLPCTKVLGGWRGRAKAFRPASAVNVSAMSYGSLSAPAVEAINRGCNLSGCLHNTGEGGLAPQHRHGGDLIWQLGTGYYGCRRDDGGFDRDMFLERVADFPVRAVEIKLSQGAKPGQGGVLPGAKVTPEIAGIRGIPIGKTCISPARHSAFGDVDGLLDFVEDLADRSGLPIGIKSAVGDLGFWHTLADRIATTGRCVDYIAIDGGEGGTGAAPLAFADHVSLPFKVGFSRVYRVFAEHNLTDKIVFIGSGKLGFPESGLLAMTLGCDLLALAREPMLAIGCIQAQRCHTGHCPTGVATQGRWLMRGLDPTSKAARLANYMVTLRKELLTLGQACGVPHPAWVTSEQLEILDGCFGTRTVTETFGYEPGWGVPSAAERASLMAD